MTTIKTTSTFDVRNANGDTVATLTAAEVCAVYRIEPSELDWAIEEYGHCTVANDGGAEFHIVPRE